MAVMDDTKRYELKFSISGEMVEAIRERIKPFVELDPYCGQNGNGGIYTVRSIYFDTEDFLVCHQKIDGEKIRKKLRLRAYDNYNKSSSAFLEIKRKYDNTVAKERFRIPLVKVNDTLNGRPFDCLKPDSTFIEKKALSRFIYNHKQLRLRPVLLVT